MSQSTNNNKSITVLLLGIGRIEKMTAGFAARLTVAAICWLLFAQTSAHLPINNGLTEEPTVACGASAVAITIRTRAAYGGRVFVKGYSRDRDCQALGDARRPGLSLSVPFNRCGMTQTRELNGVSVSTTLVISFHTIFITKVDRVYRVHCFYTERRRESVTQALGVDETALSTRALAFHGEAPTCRYDILSGSADGPPVKYAKIGDLIYHKWTCDSPTPNTYCMRIHSCAVTDGQGGLPFYVLDESGCESDAYVFQSLYYISDLIAGQYAYVFKFADRPTLHFNCQVELTMKPTAGTDGCKTVQPKCPPSGTTTRPDSVIAPEPESRPPYGEVYGTKTTIDYSLNVQTVSRSTDDYSNSAATIASTILPIGNNPADTAIDYDPKTTESPFIYGNKATKTAIYGNEASTAVYGSEINSNAAVIVPEAWNDFRLNGVEYRLNNSRDSSPGLSNPDEYLAVPPARQEPAYGSSRPLTSYRLAGPASPILLPAPTALLPTVVPQIVPLATAGPVFNNQARSEPASFSASRAVPASSINVDTIYSDETEASAVRQRAVAFDFIDPTSDSSQSIRQAPLKQGGPSEQSNAARHVVVSDVHVPERSLIVVDIDENTLAQQLLDNTASSQEAPIIRTSSEPYAENGCVSYVFFVAFSLANALLAAGVSALLTVVTFDRWRSADSADSCRDSDSRSSASGIYEIPRGRRSSAAAAAPLRFVDWWRQFAAFQRENVGHAFGQAMRRI